MHCELYETVSIMEYRYLQSKGSVKFKEVPQITDDEALRSTSEAPSSSIIFERRRTSVQLMSPKLIVFFCSSCWYKYLYCY